jgi:UDP:flavonoid glycosyltransferase YjiC (YdhE family)
MADLKRLIDSCLEDAQYTEGRRQVKEETWAEPGQGARQAAEYLIRKYHELTGKEEEV